MAAETRVPCQDFEVFQQLHKVQLVNAGIPPQYWERIFEKIKADIYDAGSYFNMAKDEDENWHVLVSNENGLKLDDSNGVFLVDHAWTFEAEYARNQLRTNAQLLVRMANFLEVVDPDSEEYLMEELVNKVMEKLWLYCHTYKVAKTIINEDGSLDIEQQVDKKITLWYMLDEFGSRFSHSDEPNVEFKLFFYVPTQLTYSLIFPLKDIEFEEEAVRDYLSGAEEDKQRDSRLYPWFPDRLNLEEVVDDWLEKIDLTSREDRCSEKISDRQTASDVSTSNETLKVYTECKEVEKFLSHSRFVLHDDIETADILWLYDHFKDFKSLAETPGKIVNQFPSENILTNKDLLAEVAMRSVKLDGRKATDDEICHRGPMWLPTTFNLSTELPKFIKHFKEREARGLNNIWMCKPWNLARGLDHTITNNLTQIIRLVDTGPKVACKYIEDPLLFRRDDVGNVKFDIRFMVVLKSVKPLRLYAYKIFYLRFANVQYSQDDFEMYEKHLTVMNYRGAELHQIHWDDFKKRFQDQFPGQEWDNIESKTFEIIKLLFKSAVSRLPPNGIGHSTQSRAMYGLDFMYKWQDKEKTSIQPMLIEVNYMPSIKRCCKYEPHLVNDFFQTMFLEEMGDNFVKLF
ncbi:tubulin--tyrosine ligase-like protein 12 [Rhopilema esculentum]|uniref:tubulin--tyrosine ligase-like protein 12 n=1 Tax=Rhopilema esculentum TaxID=499914 RepID=UPI0031D2E7A2|eukprot:gene4219-20407_t